MPRTCFRTLYCIIASMFLFPAASMALEPSVTNSLGMEFVLVPAGTFVMGADKKEGVKVGEDESPAHKVTITKPFYLGKYEVTQGQWEAIMGENPSSHKGANLPVDTISWDNIYLFVRKLNQIEGQKYRLPTEAEWEYAARAGGTGLYSFGDNVTELGQYGWFKENSRGKPHPVGQRKPNAFGLYDMHGNVWEWVHDWYQDTYYTQSPEADPKGPNKGLYRAERGGSWDSSANALRPTVRISNPQDTQCPFSGFRLVLVPQE